MKILFATDNYLPTPGGISVVTHRMTTELAKVGHTVGLIAPSTSWKSYKEEKEGVTIFRIQSFLFNKAQNVRYSPTFFHKRQIAKIFQEFKPDIVHLETPDAIAYSALEEAKKQNIPVIATCHIMPQNISGALPFLPSQISKIVGNLYMRQMAQVFNRVDFVTAPTNTGIAILQANGVRVPKEALSNGIDLAFFQRVSKENIENFRERLNLPALPIVLYVGRLDKEKSVDVLVKAFAYIKNLQCHLVISGKGEMQSALEKIVKEFSLQKRVSFVGYLESKDLPSLYSLSTVFVMPSTAELQSLVTMEAMAAKTPVIGARAGALPYLIKPSRNGFLFSPGNSRDLAEKIDLVLSSKKMQEAMGEESYKIVSRHDIHKIIRKLENLYKKIILQKRKQLLATGMPQRLIAAVSENI